jgi:SAM-dependent methyltransferase
MQPAEYAVMAEREASHWWYRGLRRLVVRALAHQWPCGSPERIVDVGCGTGGGYVLLRRRYPDSRYVGVDVEPDALRHCRERGLTTVALASANAMPLRAGVADAIVCLDVLYYADIDPSTTLRGFFRLLRPSGVLILNVPALEALRGEHDRAVGIAHRFDLDEVRRLCEGAGFEILHATYWNFALLVPMLVWRRFTAWRGAPAARSDVGRGLGWLNAVCRGLIHLDVAVAGTLGMPLGSSVFVVARRPA